jgi:hypothetical protein
MELVTLKQAQNRLESLELAVDLLTQEISILKEDIKNVRRGDD